MFYGQTSPKEAPLDRHGGGLQGGLGDSGAMAGLGTQEPTVVQGAPEAMVDRPLGV